MTTIQHLLARNISGFGPVSAAVKTDQKTLTLKVVKIEIASSVQT